MRPHYMPTVTELLAFTACARHATTTRAAQELNLTQSAVSRAIGTLETRLGVPLFDRVRKRLILSPAGRVFLERAEAVLADLDGAAMGAMAFGGAQAVLRIAALPSFARSWLIPRLARFQALVPEVSLDLSARLHPVDFEREPLDLAIMRSEHESPGSILTPLTREELIVIAAPRLLSGREALSDAELLGLPLLQQSTRPTLWLDWFRASAQPQAEAPRDILRGARFDHFDMVMDAAASGMGLGLVPAILAEAALDEARLVQASPRRFATGQDYALITPERGDSAVAHQFRDWLLAEIRR